MLKATEVDDPPPDSGRVRMTCGDPDFRLEGWLGPDSPRYTGGFGGWTITGRPRQVGMVSYEGVEPIQLEFQMVWDGRLTTGGAFKHREHELSIEPHLRELLAVVRGDNESHPGIIRIQGIPSLPSKRWVIQNVDFGDAIRRVSDMHRTRLMMTFTMLEYIPPKFKKLKKRPFGKDLGKTVIYTVKKNDTPHKIAKRKQCKWTDIRDLNQGVVRKANQKLSVGTKLRVPARRARQDKK